MRTVLRRCRDGVLLATFVLPPLVGALFPPPMAPPPCETFRVTGYASATFTGTTADGTPTRGNEWTIAAAHQRLPFGTYVWIEDVGTVRIADRGLLDWSDLDVLVPSNADAYQLTGLRRGCITF